MAFTARSGTGSPKPVNLSAIAEWWVGEVDLCGGEAVERSCSCSSGEAEVWRRRFGGTRARACDRRARQGRRMYGGTSSGTARQPLVLMLVRGGSGQYKDNFFQGINEAHLSRKWDNMRWWTRLKPYRIIRGLRARLIIWSTADC